MNITKKQDGAKLTIAISGRVDTTTAPQLESEIKNAPAEMTDLVLDLSELEYISSAGLRVLLSAQKMMNSKGSMTVKGASEISMEIFEVTGFVDLLNIEE